MESTIILVLFCVLIAFLCEFKSCVKARDTITHNRVLQSDNGETLVSAKGRFELGFFAVNGGTFVGIWYYNLSPRTYVWVLNRNAPLPQVPGYLVIFDDGNLKLLDNDGTSYFSTYLQSSAPADRTLRLLDSGNLVLIENHSGKYLWQSFAEPTDTFLPGMMMDENLKLVSWMDSSNPANGSYTFQAAQKGNPLFKIMNRTITYWQSDDSGSTDLPTFLTTLLSNFSEGPKRINSTNRINSTVFLNMRLMMNSSGEMQLYNLYLNEWLLIRSEPHDACSVFRPCGKFGLCSVINGRARCECLPGFDPVLPYNWERGDFSNGCQRKVPVCNYQNSKPDRFLNLKFMDSKKPDPPIAGLDSEEICRQECLNNCQTQCEAYYYERDVSRNGRGGCWIWTSELSNLQEDSFGGHDLYVRVPASSIGLTSRDCEPCGKYIIPYPLSSNHNCGDPSYNSFSCDNSTGQLSFFMMNNSYQVIDINSETRRFVIQVKNQTAADNCSQRTSVLQLNQSSPFDVTNWCYTEQLNLTGGLSRKGRQGIEIVWKPPLEPVCNSSFDCQDWPDSNCSAVQGSKRCLCNSNYRWDGQALNCITVSASLAVAANEGKRSEQVIIGTTISAVVLLIVIASISCFFHRRRILAKGDGISLSLCHFSALPSILLLVNIKRTKLYCYLFFKGKESIPGNPVHFSYDNEGDVEDLVDEENNIVDVAFFSLESILEATENFADANKLGQGGFGPVYKGKFPGEKEVAVKRLSSHSGQGMDEFRNEVVLIAKLQHRNLVKLLGYCIKGSERLLLYEYMPNKSLDTFIFDQERCVLLDWNMRFDIILGIARGLLYLHQDSRLRIIHRDLKTSNILLDDHMNPKISDFGLARIFAGKETEANTMRVVGTYGYMSPEYAQAGFYSVKSDVFSFGVIVLEILSGKKNTGFYHSEEALSLLEYAWRFWEEGKAIDLVDGRVLKSSNITDVMKCINIGFLCVQEDPGDRPTMSNVVTMLGSEVTTLPGPKKPGFVSGKYTFSMFSSSSLQAETRSVNKLSVTLPEGR